MTNEELNEKLAALADDEQFVVQGLGHGKAIPYYGWWWRSVDFDQPITFAYANGEGFDVPSWVGFCERNKWGYEMFTATEEQSQQVRRLCVEFVEQPSSERAQAVFDYLQSIRPEHVRGEKRWGDE